MKTIFISHGSDNEEDDDIEASAIPAALGYTNDYDDDDDDDDDKEEEDRRRATVHGKEGIFLST